MQRFAILLLVTVLMSACASPGISLRVAGDLDVGLALERPLRAGVYELGSCKKWRAVGSFTLKNASGAEDRYYFCATPTKAGRIGVLRIESLRNTLCLWQEGIDCSENGCMHLLNADNCHEFTTGGALSSEAGRD